MTVDHHLEGLLADINAITDRIARQKQQDADHEVALAMFAADLRRAELKLATYQRKPNTRSYIDGRRAA